MKNTVVVNSEFAQIENFIKKIPETLNSLGTVIYKGRNEIRRIKYEGFVLNIKSYKVPIFINKIAYTFFRPSKAKRSYNYALRLLQKGFDTPRPVAYIECKKMGLLNNSYFISIHNDTAFIFRDIQHKPLNNDIEEILQQMAQYVAQMHNNDILHLDFSPGNILIEKQNNKWHFSIIDINRMRFGKVSNNEGMLNFGRLCLPEDKVKIIAKYYAQARGIDEDFCLKTMLQNNAHNIYKFSVGKERKNKLLKPFKKLLK